MDTEQKLPVLTAPEIRVLGALIEKSQATPDYYPMTLNALTAACNQKTSRHPVVEYDEPTVQQALNSLKAQSLISTAIGGSIRAVKYKHNFLTVYDISDAELTILCLLMLRGAQTAGEINANSTRLHGFASLERVYDVLNKLSTDTPPFVKEIPRKPGQKERRFMHLLAGEHHEEDHDGEDHSHKKVSSEFEDRLTELETELAKVKETLYKLVKDLQG